MTYTEFRQGNYLSTSEYKEFDRELQREAIIYYRRALCHSEYKVSKYQQNMTSLVFDEAKGFIAGIFIWSCSLKGHEYWNNIARKLLT